MRRLRKFSTTSLLLGHQMPEYITGCSADFMGATDGERKREDTTRAGGPLGIPLGFPVPGGSSVGKADHGHYS